MPSLLERCYYPLAVAVAASFLGCIYSENQVYGRFRSDSCKYGVFNKWISDSELCCDDVYRSNDWICIAAYDNISSIMTSGLAWALPLLPLILSFIFDIRSIDSNKAKIYLSRLGFYILLFSYRTVSLNSNIFI